MIRRQLDIDEVNPNIYLESINGDFDVLFLGDCMGIALSKRSQNDEHIVFTILHEDDGYWFPSINPASSFWINDLKEVIDEVIKYLNNWASKEEDGWTFKCCEECNQLGDKCICGEIDSQI